MSAPRIVKMAAVRKLKPNKRNARTHSKKQIRQIANSILRFGWTYPILVDEDGNVIAGHGRLQAAELLGLHEVPTMTMSGLSETEKRALVLADNKIAANAGWDRATLVSELGELAVLLPDCDLSIDITGFESADIDNLMGDLADPDLDPADDTPAPAQYAVSAIGDLWMLGPHRLMCGDCLSPAHVRQLPTSIISSSGRMDDIAPMSGIIPVSTPFAKAVWPSSPCIRRSSQWHSLPTRCAIVRDAVTLFLILLWALARQSWPPNASVDAGIFGGYRLQIVVGADAAESVVLQAALLTAINCGARSFLGGVTVVGASGPLRVTLPLMESLEGAAVAFGARLAADVRTDLPTIILGDVGGIDLEPFALRVTFTDWCGGVVPARSNIRLDEKGVFTPAGVLAGALGVAEVFQRVRGGTPMACRRTVGLNLWDLHRDWLSGGSAPAPDRLPADVWIVGMGNLGQAYLWTLGLLPYQGGDAHLVLQDRDVVATSNLSTSMLTARNMLGKKKTREMADWCERRGFKTSIIERDFAPDFRIGPRDPAVALIGVDNALARQAIEDVGFGRVIEAGLGRGPLDFLGIDLHTFPASKNAREVWPDTGVSDVDITQPAYRAMLERSGDRCGTVQLAGRSIGAPFVGSVAASLVVAELMRLCLSGQSYEVISCHLRDVSSLMVARGAETQPFNPGSTAAAA